MNKSIIMNEDYNSFKRGAEWRQWDLHIHTPASFHWEGERFDRDPDSLLNKRLVDEMIKAMNNAKPAVFAIMDYWNFDGWFALQKRLKDSDAPKLRKKVFPGIELRLVSPGDFRLNVHAIFSDEISDQRLKNFLSTLKVELVDSPLSEDSLIRLVREKTGADKLNNHGFKIEKINHDDDEALRAGSTIAEITCESYIKAMKEAPNNQAVSFMPFGTSDGLDKINWIKHYAYVSKLFRSSPIFETRNLDLRDAFVMKKTSKNEQWFENFKNALNNRARLAVSGSDAHRFAGVEGNDNKRGYGDFPSNKITWIKGDTTFLGLLQAIEEPEKRSHIREKPEKLNVIEQNKSYFIDSIEITKDPTSKIPEEWLNNCKVLLNPDLVAIIGNKGSGKSALVDIIALLGNSEQKEHFSFLKKGRFYGKSGEPAKYFTGTIKWLNQSSEEYILSDSPSDEKPPLVRYIPQGHFESICNDHASGGILFQKELESVIFKHAGSDIRLGSLNFDQLKEQQESVYRARLEECRKNLGTLNLEIGNIEKQLHPTIKGSLEELLAIKKKQIKDHMNVIPDKLKAPSEQLSEDEKKTSDNLEVIGEKLKEVEKSCIIRTATNLNLSARLRSIKSIREHQQILENQFQKFRENTEKDFKNIEIEFDETYSLTLNSATLQNTETEISKKQKLLSAEDIKEQEEKTSLLSKQTVLKEKLNARQLAYQQNLKSIETWKNKLDELNGTSEMPETLKGIEERISQLDELPRLLKEKTDIRKILTGDIFDILDEQRCARERLFKPVQDLIQNNSLIQEEFKLQFQAMLGATRESMIYNFYSLIKQNTGEFRGEDESYSLIIKLFEKYDITNKSDLLLLIEELNAKIHDASLDGNLETMLRKDKKIKDVYDLIYGLSYIEPRYSLVFQNTKIEQLSPGQRGALLLIFYLLVDKGQNPIILDQPEENLDNETVFNLLVPVLSQAKKRRQVIMVTHNPNLAVVCDAEQIIYSSFSRTNNSRIEYISGAIENPIINEHVVNILEGTFPAFNNRKDKYHSKRF